MPAPPQPAVYPPASSSSAEATLLAACVDAPTVTRAWCLPAGRAGPDGRAGGPPWAEADDGTDVSTGVVGAVGPAGSPATPDTATLLVEWAQKDVAGNRVRRFLTHTTLARVPGTTALAQAASPPPVELRDAVLTSPSPSGARQLIARAAPGGKDGGGDKGVGGAILEVWGRGRCLVELAVPPTVHGPVYSADGYLSTGATWSADEARVAYVAEAPLAVVTPEWGGRPGSDGGERRDGGEAGRAPAPAEVGPKTWKGVGRAESDWGEALVGRRTAAVFVLDIPSGRVVRIPPPPPLPAGGGGEAGTSAGAPKTLSAAAAGADPAASAFSAGQPALSPCGRACVYSAWPHRAPNFPALTQRLGMVYCLNRPCALWVAAVPPFEDGGGGGEGGGGEAPPPPPPPPPPTCLTPGLTSALSPRFSPDGSTLVFLSHEAAARSGVHNATAALLKLPWDRRAAAPAGPPDVVVPVVPVPAPGGASPAASAAPPTDLGGAFPGLYCTSLPDRPFLDGGRRLALTSQWGATAEVVVVDLAARAVAPAGDRSAFPGSWAFLAAGGGWAAAAVSHPARPPEVVVIDMAGGLGGRGASGSAEAQADRPAWRRLLVGGGAPGGADPAARRDAPPPRLLRPPAASALEGVTWRVLRAKAPDVGARSDAGGSGAHPPPPPLPPVEAVVISPPNARPPPPGLLIPHGGPHSAHADGWSPPIAFLVGLGYAAILVNFRGSTGYGEAGVQALPGFIGTADVADCMAARDAAVEAGLVDGRRIALLGGSHGGFLAASLAGRHPSAWKAAILRNPVTDLALMSGVTDIADWTYVEALGSVAGRARARPDPTPADLAAFRSVSPISLVHAVTAPMLFLLGGGDRRVPPADAQRYVNALRARGAGGEGEAAAAPPPPPCRVLMFPEDGHPLDKPQTEFESFMEVAAWLKAWL